MGCFKGAESEVGEVETQSATWLGGGMDSVGHWESLRRWVRRGVHARLPPGLAGYTKVGTGPTVHARHVAGRLSLHALRVLP